MNKQEHLLELTFKTVDEAKLFPQFSDYKTFLTSNDSKLFFIKFNIMNIHEKILCLHTPYPLVLTGLEVIDFINNNSHLRFSHHKFVENDFLTRLQELNEQRLRVINLENKISEVEKPEITHKKAKI